MSTAISDETAVVPEGTWKSDPVHSWVGFQVRHMAVSNFRGEVPSFDVTVTSENGAVSLGGSAPVASITTRDENLTAHIASPDFFDAAQHPEITLDASSVSLDRDGELLVEGTLTMRGTTKPVGLRGTVSEPAEDPYGMTRVGLELSGVVDRRDYGMGWQAPLPGGGLALGHEVTVSAQIELVRQ